MICGGEEEACGRDVCAVAEMNKEDEAGSRCRSNWLIEKEKKSKALMI